MARGNVFVAGGTGGIGEACVRALLAEPRFERVIASSRDASKLSELRARTGDAGRLVTLVGSLTTAAEAEALRAQVLACGELTAVVASLGGWWEGAPLLGVDDVTWRRVLEDLLTTHFVCARAFVPTLAASGGAYLALGGGAALTPVPHSALVSIAAAAQEMLVRALVAERGTPGVPAIDELLIDAPVKTRGRHHGPQAANEITADEVAALVRTWLVTGTPGDRPDLERRGPIVVMRTRAAAFPGAASAPT